MFTFTLSYSTLSQGFFTVHWVPVSKVPGRQRLQDVVNSAQRLDLFAWCVRLSRLLVGFSDGARKIVLGGQALAWGADPAPSFPIPLLPRLSLPLSSPPLLYPPLPSLLIPSSPLRSRPPTIQLRGLGERCKLPQWGLGQSPRWQTIWCIFALNLHLVATILIISSIVKRLVWRARPLARGARFYSRVAKGAPLPLQWRRRWSVFERTLNHCTFIISFHFITRQFREFTAALLAPVHFLSPDQQSGIYFLIICALKFCFKTCVAMKFVDNDDVRSSCWLRTI